jgi:glycosyltransferase involved in cell wall biosynthesis
MVVLAESALTPEIAGERADPARPLLSVVVPVYNEAGTIVDNVGTIRDRVEDGLGEAVEVIVVSDGSIDESEERLLADASHRARVIHYDRNLGKGYAVKTGALAARGRWISFVDADLDVDPASIPSFLELARRDSLDFVIGSKRHPESLVHYPRSRRMASWLYQKMIRLLFSLDVRDTQVGLKVFKREVAEEVMPLLLVKQFAFDLEFLAVAHALGYRRIKEQPITLKYRFTGSGVRSPAVLLALVDTAAIFYRLRILRYYQRKLPLLQEYVRAQSYRPHVTLVSPDDAEGRVEYSELSALAMDVDKPERRRDAAERARGELVAFLEHGATPARNWLESTIPFLANPEIAAVVVPSMPSGQGSIRERAAAAVAESRLGGGSHHFRFTPGNLRFVHQYPMESVVVRKADLLALEQKSLHPHRLCAALNDRGRKVLYTPETVVIIPQPPLFGPHLARVKAAGQARGKAIRQLGARGVTAASIPPVALLGFLLFGWPLLLAGGAWRLAWFLLWAAYAAALLGAGVLSTLRFQSVRVGALTMVGVVAVHVTYALGLIGAVFPRGAK